MSKQGRRKENSQNTRGTKQIYSFVKIEYTTLDLDANTGPTTLNATRQPTAHDPTDDQHTDKILILGDLPRWQAEGRDTSPTSGFHFAAPDSIDQKLLAELNPALILSPLSGDSFDVIDVAENLQQMAFTGRYRAIVAGPSNAPQATDVIRADVAQAAPDVDFDVLVIPD